MKSLAPWPYPALIAHRGAGKLAPENTLAAFRLGAGFGYTAFEFDVKLSSDGKSFLLHDTTLDRTSNGHGRADLYTLSELAQFDAGSWHSSEYSGEQLPTLATIAHYTIANNYLVNIEIKPTEGREYETGAAVALDAACLWKNSKIPPLLSSFSVTALQAASAVQPELPRALLVDNLPADWLTTLRSLQCIALDADHRLLTADIVQEAKAHGFRVLCYTVNEIHRMHELRGWGVDSIITDAVDIISPQATWD
jgi:glycerophosphoryl diester phosphodiesterase